MEKEEISAKIYEYINEMNADEAQDVESYLLGYVHGVKAEQRRAEKKTVEKETA